MTLNIYLFKCTPQSSSCMANYYPLRKLSNLDEPDMRESTGELRTNSSEIYSCGPLHMDGKRQDDQPEPTYNSSADTGCSVEDWPGAMDDREGWRERIKEIRAGSATWWWWWWFSGLFLRHSFYYRCWSTIPIRLLILFRF